MRIGFTRRPSAAEAMGFTATGPDPYFDICRQLTDAGVPDQPDVFFDERGVACLTVASIHACARRYRPNAADDAAKVVRREARDAMERGKSGC